MVINACCCTGTANTVQAWGVHMLSHLCLAVDDAVSVCMTVVLAVATRPVCWHHKSCGAVSGGVSALDLQQVHRGV